MFLVCNPVERTLTGHDETKPTTGDALNSGRVVTGFEFILYDGVFERQLGDGFFHGVPRRSRALDLPVKADQSERRVNDQYQYCQFGKYARLSAQAVRLLFSQSVLYYVNEYTLLYNDLQSF